MDFASFQARYYRALDSSLPEVPDVDVDLLYKVLYPGDTQLHKKAAKWNAAVFGKSQKSHAESMELINNYKNKLDKWKKDNPQMAKMMDDCSNKHKN